MDLQQTDVTASDGTRLRLWNVSDSDASEAVLFVHGATYPTRAVFAPPIEDQTYSWLHGAARRGRAAFAVDLRGYGESDSPTSTDGENDSAIPARAEDAADDVAAALEAIRDRFDRVHLVGYSWGSIVCGYYLTAVEDDVASLTQAAPVYRPPPEVGDRFAGTDSIEPFRRITREDVRDRWDEQIPEEVPPAEWRGDGGDGSILDAVWKGIASSNHRLKGTDAPTVAVPNGTLLDLRAAANDEPVYDAAEIAVPTLVVRGTLDPTATRTDALALYDELADGAPTREYAEIGGATHFLPVERRRTALYDAVDSYQTRTGSRR